MSVASYTVLVAVMNLALRIMIRSWNKKECMPVEEKGKRDSKKQKATGNRSVNSENVHYTRLMDKHTHHRDRYEQITKLRMNIIGARSEIVRDLFDCWNNNFSTILESIVYYICNRPSIAPLLNIEI